MKTNAVKLCDVCEVSDGTHYTPQNTGGPFPFLTVKDMTDEGLSFSGCSYVSAVEFEKAKKAGACPEPGVVLFSKDGTVGKVHVVRHDRPFAALSSIALLRPDKSQVDSDYLGFAMRSPAILKDAVNRKTGSALQRIILADLKEVSVPLPNLSEQRRIVGELERADGLRRIRRYALELADTFHPAAFLQLFGDPGTNPKDFPLEQVESVFSEKRDGVKCGPFGSALKKHEYVSGGIPVWTVDCIGKNEFFAENCLYITPAKYEELRAYSAENNDILVSRAGTVGRMAIVQTKYPQSIIHSNVIRLSLNPAKCQPVFFVTLMTHFASRVGRLKRGQEDAYSFMNTSTLGELQIPLPPPELQTRFVELVERHERLRSVQRESLRQAEHLFQSLLHQAFTL
jgi:type I restriction enzyme S subunit